MTDLVQRWSDGLSSYQGVVVAAHDETDAGAFKKFVSTEDGSHAPSLSVTYNSYPDIPDNLSVSDTDTFDPTFHATFADADGGQGHVVYSISVEGEMVDSMVGPDVESGNDSPGVSTTDLEPGITYEWQAVAVDSTGDYSEASSLQEFEITPPEGTIRPADQLGVDAEDVDTAMQTATGDRYAYTWISGGTITVGVVDPQSSDESALAEATPAGDSSEIEEVAFSALDLDTYLSNVDDIMGDDPADVSWWGVEPKANRVEVHLTAHNSTLEADLATAGPSGSIAMMFDGSVTGYPPYKAGVFMVTPISGQCGLGFIVIVHGGVHDGVKRGTTAGHCGHNGDYVHSGSSGSTNVGTIGVNTYFGHTYSAGDSAKIDLSNEANATRLIYLNPSYDRTVNASKGSTGWVHGTQFFYSGPSSGVHGGSLDAVNIRTHYDGGHWVVGLNCIDSKSGLLGDSGSPMFQVESPGAVARAIGLVVAIRHDGDFNPTGVCFDPMWHVNAQLGTVTWIG
jgi:hypothetical protein